MEAKQAIDKVIADLASLKKDGRKTIPIENLERYLVSIAVLPWNRANIGIL